jgi:phytoene synthase
VTTDFETCEKAVRTHDPDRFFAILFAPAEARPHLFALAALYYELAHASATPREPMLKQIRLTWWRETIELARAGTARDHAVARALAETFRVHNLPQALFDRLIEARMNDGAGADFADATVGSLMRLMACVLGGEADMRDAAIAYGLAGRENALAQAHHAAAKRIRYPRALLPAVLPAALVPLYCKTADPPLWRKQIVYLSASLRGRI